MRELAPEARGIVKRLRAEAAPIAALALLKLVLSGAEESTLFARDRDALRDQLTDVSHLLDVHVSRSVADGSRGEEAAS